MEDAVPADANEQKGVKTITLRQFLETVPPSQTREISDLIYLDSRYELSKPDIQLVCEHELCGGVRTFRFNRGSTTFYSEDTKSTYIRYVCSNCEEAWKEYSLYASIIDLENRMGTCYKYGELPPFGPPTPPRLLRLFGGDKEIFLKGRRCESQGLGVGAFTYYRRVVENRKNQILDEVIKVAKTVNAPPTSINALEAAKNENQFSKAIDSIKTAIPPVLLVNGQNPLTLLHSALSVGVHDSTDEKCLEVAHDVRLLLAEMAERINTAVRDEAELNEAVNRLTNMRSNDQD